MLLVVTAKAVRASQHSANAMEAWVRPMVETTIDVANKATGAAINKREFLTVYETGDRKTASLRKREAPSGMIFSPTKNLP